MPATSFHITSPIHAAHVISRLERGGLTLDQFVLHYGEELDVELGGNGDHWYNNDQVEEFYRLEANVPTPDPRVAQLYF